MFIMGNNIATEMKANAIAQKVLDFLNETNALDLGASPWGTYDDDEFVSPFDFEKFFGNDRCDEDRPKLPMDFVEEISMALDTGSYPTEDQMEFPGRSGNAGATVSWDTCAWYQPLHFFGSDWGIFIREECLLRVAISIAEHSDAQTFHAERSDAVAKRMVGKPFPAYWTHTDAEIFLRAAVVCLFLHEHYHHRVECLGIRLHVVTQKPLYVPYSKGVYNAVVGTDDLLEEALANACIFLRLSEQTYRKMLPESVREGLKRKLIASYSSDPPGYRMASIYLDQLKFNAGENLLQGFVRETSMKPVQPNWYWENAPRLTQSFLNIKSNIYTVVPIGQRPILSPQAMPLSCSKEQLIRVCKKQGFNVLPKRGVGSHTVMSKAGTAGIVTIPDKKNLSIAVIKNTLATIGGYKVHDLPNLLKS